MNKPARCPHCGMVLPDKLTLEFHIGRVHAEELRGHAEEQRVHAEEQRVHAEEQRAKQEFFTYVVGRRQHGELVSAIVDSLVDAGNTRPQAEYWVNEALERAKKDKRQEALNEVLGGGLMFGIGLPIDIWLYSLLPPGVTVHGRWVLALVLFPIIGGLLFLHGIVVGIRYTFGKGI